MLKASICTIGYEILIGQVTDTNSAHIAQALEQAGIHVQRMLSVGDSREDIQSAIRTELDRSDIVITTGGLGPTKDDITKAVLADLSGSTGYKEDPGQLEMVHKILKSRGLDVLPSNLAQAMVPQKAHVIVNRLGTAPIMVFRSLLNKGTLYALPGVPHEAVGAIPAVLEDILANFRTDAIVHRSMMVYGIAESALSERISPWEDALPPYMHLAYLPNTITGIRLRLSAYGGDKTEREKELEGQFETLKNSLGTLVYASDDTTLEATLGKLLKKRGETVSAAESCTGGEIAHLFTSVSGSSAYFLGSVTSYAISVKEQVLGVPAEVIREHGVVSAEVAAAMANGVKRLTGSTYSVATTGLADKDGDGTNPGGTVWIGVAGPRGTRTVKYCYKNDRARNIERFAASALNFLRLYIENSL